MIDGQVTADREAVIDVRVRGPDHREVTVKAVIDTGYTDYMILPHATIAVLSMPRLGPVEYTLGDNSTVMMDLFACEALWHGRWRLVAAAACRSGALVGMALMSGSELRMTIVEGGPVTIKAV
jgi:predicted aspartyl protease